MCLMGICNMMFYHSFVIADCRYNTTFDIGDNHITVGNTLPAHIIMLSIRCRHYLLPEIYIINTHCYACVKNNIGRCFYMLELAISYQVVSIMFKARYIMFILHFLYSLHTYYYVCLI